MCDTTLAQKTVRIAFWRVPVFCRSLERDVESMTFGEDVRVSPVYAILSKTRERNTYGEATTPTVAAD